MATTGKGRAHLVETTTPKVGTIFGDVTTTGFRFHVEHKDVTATMYVSVGHEGAQHLAQVIRVEREADNDGGDQLVAHAKVIGRRNDRGRLVTPTTPPKPGAAVHKAKGQLVRSAMNLQDKGAYLGRLRGLDLDVRLDMNELVQKHCSILAKTGAGKSYALGVLMEELLEHRVPIVVIDPHGEHASLAAPNSSDREVPLMRRFKIRPKSYADRVVEYAVETDAIPDALPFKLDGRDLTARELGQLLGGSLTSAQTGVLHQAVRDLEDHGSYTLEDIIHMVEQQSGASRWPVLQALEDLEDLDILSENPTPVQDLVQDGQATVLNLKGTPPHVQDLVVARITQDLFEARKIGLIAPHLCVLEEAHNFCPERNMSKAASGEILRTIASEGRKFGMGLAVVSQRPAKIDKNVLSQCNTQIILKVTNKNDLRAISQSVEGLPPGMEDEIQALPIGTALVSEPTIAVPLFCEIRPRATRHGGASLAIVGEDDNAAASSGPVAQPAPGPEEGAARGTGGQARDELTFEQASSDGGQGIDAHLVPDADGDPDPEAEPGTGELDAPELPATMEDPLLDEIERTEADLAGAPLGGLSPGALEALTAEVEALLTLVDELLAGGEHDPGRLSGLEAALGAHHRRLLGTLEARC